MFFFTFNDEKLFLTRGPEGVLRHSPDLFNNVKVGQGQLLIIIKHILFYQKWSSSILVK